MAQQMPLPLTVSCFSKIQIVLPFWYQLTRVVPDKGPLNVCARARVYAGCEVSGVKWRAAFGIYWNAMLALGAATMPAVSYFIRDYRHLQAVYTWPQLAFFTYALYVPAPLV